MLKLQNPKTQRFAQLELIDGPLGPESLRVSDDDGEQTGVMNVDIAIDLTRSKFTATVRYFARPPVEYDVVAAEKDSMDTLVAKFQRLSALRKRPAAVEQTGELDAQVP